ncbi:reverse transcriptase domain-containing protein [Tanacetum coccineum]
MTSPTRGGGPEGRDDREGTPPLTKEQIEGHISAMKSIIKEHNKRNKANPVRLNFETEDQDPKEDRIVKRREVDDDDLSKPFKETLKTPFTRRIIEFSGPEYSMPTNIALYDGSTDPADHLNHRSTTSPSGIVEDVFVKVEKFHFLADFVVVDYVVGPRVPLILGKPFLRTVRALIDVYGEELTLRVDDEAITFKVGQTLRYSYNDVVSINRIDVIDVAFDDEAITFKVDQTSSFSYNDAESINRIDVIVVDCEEYAQEVLRFLEISTSGNPTSEPIISISSPTLTPFQDSDFLLEEFDAFLAIEDDSISPEIDDFYYDSEGDIRLLEEFLNDDPSSLLHPKELKFVEPKTEKSSIDEPPELELKDLPSHLEYAFLEGADKLPVIISKNLKDDDKARLLKVLKSHKRAIAWKLSDIKGIDP